MGEYIIIPDEWANTMEGKENLPNIFRASVTVDGRVVVSVNAIGDFPGDFALLIETGFELEHVELTSVDFPYSPPKIKQCNN